jgi:hypothetical protein
MRGFLMKTLAERLKWLRSERGLKSKKVAAVAIGIRYGTYQRYEYGGNPSETHWKKLIEFYCCSRSWLQQYRSSRSSSLTSPIGEFKIRDVVYMATQILESGTSYAHALYLNIVHFDRALQGETRIEKCEGDIRRLEGEVESMKKMVEKLSEENKLLKGCGGSSAPIDQGPAAADPTGTDDPKT